MDILRKPEEAGSGRSGVSSTGRGALLLAFAMLFPQLVPWPARAGEVEVPTWRCTWILPVIWQAT